MDKQRFIPTTQKLANDLATKVFASMVTHVYSQTNIALVASLFCASIIFIGLFPVQADRKILFGWFAFFLTVTTFRFVLVNMYEKKRLAEKKIKTWANLYIVGSILGGISWGLPGVLLFPYVTALQQTLLILMLAGVTAGAVPMSSAIPSSALGFLFFSILPYIISIALLNNPTYLLFDSALLLYLVYSIILVMKTYKVIKNSIQLKFENDVLLKNLTEAKKQLEISNKKLQLTATHDPLTKVANRDLFEMSFAEALKRARSSKKILALLYFDFDDFKPVNDMYGHHAGDLLLKSAIDKLRNFFGTDSIIARLGGDEFTIILENMDSVEMVADIAQQICQLLAKPVKLKNINLQTSASIGIGLYPYDGTNVEALLWVADQTMYYVKEHGGNHFYFYKDLVALSE